MSSTVALFLRSEFIILSSADRARIASSPGDIHFWTYDDVTDNCVLDLQRKNSIRKAFVPLLFWFLPFTHEATRYL